jgi:hypothetical protein
MNDVSPAWFDVPGFNWNDLSRNARIAARRVHAGAEVFPCHSHVFEDDRGNIHGVKTPKTPMGVCLKSLIFFISVFKFASQPCRLERFRTSGNFPIGDVLARS